MTASGGTPPVPPGASSNGSIMAAGDIGWMSPRPTLNPLAVTALVLAATWIWWIGTFLSIIFGTIAWRQIKRSDTRQCGLRWLRIAAVFAAIGVATFGLAGTFLATRAWHDVTRHFYDDTATGHLNRIVSALSSQTPVRESASSIRIVGRQSPAIVHVDRIEVLPPDIPSQGPGEVSVLLDGFGPKGAYVAYASVKSSSGTCWLARLVARGSPLPLRPGTSWLRSTHGCAANDSLGLTGWTTDTNHVREYS